MSATNDVTLNSIIDFHFSSPSKGFRSTELLDWYPFFFEISGEVLGSYSEPSLNQVCAGSFVPLLPSTLHPLCPVSQEAILYELHLPSSFSLWVWVMGFTSRRGKARDERGENIYPHPFQLSTRLWVPYLALNFVKSPFMKLCLFKHFEYDVFLPEP